MTPGNAALGVLISVCTTAVSDGGGCVAWACGQIKATVSARSPTKSRDQDSSTGSVRAPASWRISAGLAAGNTSSSVSAAKPKPRSGSGTVSK